MCQHANDATNLCNDNQYCTVSDYCSSEACDERSSAFCCIGSARDCSDSNPQTTDSCSESADSCLHTVIVHFPSDFTSLPNQCAGGDFNRDGSLSSADVPDLTAILNQIQQTGIYTGALNASCADVNGDGKRTSDDLACLSGLISAAYTQLSQCPDCVASSVETCHDGQDNDCDGQTDVDTVSGQDDCLCSSATPCNMTYDIDGIPGYTGESGIKRCNMVSGLGSSYAWRAQSQWVCNASRSGWTLACAGHSFTCNSVSSQWAWRSGTSVYPTSAAVIPVCDNDGDCETGETNSNCPNDCPLPYVMPIFNQWHTYAQVVQQLQMLEDNFPSIAKVYEIGTTWKGNKMYALKISDNVAQDESEMRVLYTGATHGQEKMGTEALLYFAHFMLANYSTNSYIKGLVDSREIWLVPVVNPDGYINNCRKNCRDNNGDGQCQCRNSPTITVVVDGVDLNRNFAYGWGNNAGLSSAYTTSIVYRGPSPFSEPESQAIRQLEIQKDFKYVLSYHTAGAEVFVPWSYVNVRPPAGTGQFYYLTSHDLAYLLDRASTVTFYTDLQEWGPEWANTLWSGEETDYAYGETQEKQRAYPFCIELNHQSQADRLAVMDATVKAAAYVELYILNDPLANGHAYAFDKAVSYGYTGPQIDVRGEWNCHYYADGSSYGVPFTVNLTQQSGQSFSGTARTSSKYAVTGRVIGTAWFDDWTRPGYSTAGMGRISPDGSSYTSRWISSGGATGTDVCVKA